MKFEIKIPVRQIILFLILVVLLLMAVDLIDILLDSVPVAAPLAAELRKSFNLLFDFNLEANVPTYISSVMLLASAVILSGIALTDRQNGRQFTPQWSFLAVIFYLLSLDEAAQFHEKLGYPVRLMFNGANTRPLWIIGGVLFVIGMLYFFWNFLGYLPARTRWSFIIAGILFVSGSIIVDAFASWFILTIAEKQDLIYRVTVFVEEMFEFSGEVLFLSSLLWFVSRNHPVLALNLNLNAHAHDVSVN